MRQAACRAAVVAAAVWVTVLAQAAPQLKDPKIASRALTDADMEKYVAILGEVKKAQKGIAAISSPAGMEAQRQATARACDAQGWGTLDYGVVDARVKTAQQHIRMEKTTPVPASKAADVALVRAWAAKIAEAGKR
jgi:hypothetical protein